MQRTLKAIPVIYFCMMTGFTLPLNATIFMYRDPNGVRHFTNAPTSPGYKVYCREYKKGKSVSGKSSRFDPLITRAASRHGVSFCLLKAIIRAESGFNPEAVSRRGAMGLMQIMPENLVPLDVQDPFDPWENISGGARYIKAMLEHFDGTLHLALAAYNAGPGIVDQYGGIPPYPETQQYVERVLSFYHSYRNKASGAKDATTTGSR